jgi:DNA-binding MarR family transcriptional regulator
MVPLVEENRLAAWRAFLTAHAAAVGRIERELAEGDDLLPLTWYDVLLELAAAPRHRLRQRDLVSAIVLTRSSVSRLVDRIEAAGLLAREPNPQDRRGDTLVLTPTGRSALRRTWPAYARAIEAHFGAYLNDEEAATLARVLGRVRAGRAPAPAPGDADLLRRARHGAQPVEGAPHER